MFPPGLVWWTCDHVLSCCKQYLGFLLSKLSHGLLIADSGNRIHFPLFPFTYAMMHNEDTKLGEQDWRSGEGALPPPPDSAL